MHSNKAMRRMPAVENAHAVCATCSGSNKAMYFFDSNANAWKSSGAWIPCAANAQLKDAKSCGAKDATSYVCAAESLKRDSSLIASKSEGAETPALAKAQATCPNSRALNLNVMSLRCATVATASYSAGAASPEVEKAQERLARSCGWNVRIFLVASNARQKNMGGAETPAVAKAHAVFARSCAFAPLLFFCASSAKAWNKAGESIFRWA
mmetsp:Transcript_17025/g.60536  ORF Transcript_17025/g.60536 Transcript_17025/m.60536 type:complete len:210 (+) Transcript_17025:242-871(+)